MKKVMVFGAFDGFHPGHLNFLKQAKEFGDFLIVSVGTDRNVEKIKGKKPLFSEDERYELIQNLKIVDQAIMGAHHNFFLQIKAQEPDVICLGYDQWADEEWVREELDKVGLKKTKVIRLAPYAPEKAKSTNMKQKSVDF